MQCYRYGHALVKYNVHMYAFGGVGGDCGESEILKSAETFHIQKNESVLVADMPEAGSAVSAVRLKNLIWLAFYKRVDYMYRYHPLENTYQRLGVRFESESPLLQRLGKLTVLVDRRSIHIFSSDGRLLQTLPHELDAFFTESCVVDDDDTIFLLDRRGYPYYLALNEAQFQQRHGINLQP